MKRMKLGTEFDALISDKKTIGMRKGREREQRPAQGQGGRPRSGGPRKGGTGWPRYKVPTEMDPQHAIRRTLNLTRGRESKFLRGKSRPRGNWVAVYCGKGVAGVFFRDTFGAHRQGKVKTAGSDRKKLLRKEASKTGWEGTKHQANRRGASQRTKSERVGKDAEKTAGDEAEKIADKAQANIPWKKKKRGGFIREGNRGQGF